MKSTTLYTLAMLAMLLACVCFLGCMSRVQPSGTGDVVCTCTLGHPEIDWVKDHAQLDQPEDCQIHGEVTE